MVDSGLLYSYNCLYSIYVVGELVLYIHIVGPTSAQNIASTDIWSRHQCHKGGGAKLQILHPPRAGFQTQNCDHSGATMLTVKLTSLPDAITPWLQSSPVKTFGRALFCCQATVTSGLLMWWCALDPPTPANNDSVGRSITWAGEWSRVPLGTTHSAQRATNMATFTATYKHSERSRLR